MSFPGPGFTGMSSSLKSQQSPVGQIPPLLQQANLLTVTLVTPNAQGISIPAGNPAAAHASPAMGWVGGSEPLATGNFGGGALKYTVKNEQGAEVLLVDACGIGDLSLRTPEGSQILRLMSSPGVQAINFLLPSGESLGELVVETKVKKDKEGKEGKEGKVKKDKEEKKSDKKDKDKDKPHKEHKDKDSPKRRYVLRNLGGQEIMTVSMKSKPKDMKLEMKIKSLQRKGEVCMIESVRGPAGNGYQIRFKSGSVTVPNEKLYATGAVIGIIDLENSHQATAAGVGHPLM